MSTHRLLNQRCVPQDGSLARDQSGSGVSLLKSLRVIPANDMLDGRDLAAGSKDAISFHGETPWPLSFSLRDLLKSFAPISLIQVFVLSAVSLLAGCASPTYDIVLAGGRVMDPASGLDAPRNVGITGGKIQAVSSEQLSGKAVIDVSGQVVAPGFIDLHAHGQTPGDLAIKAQDGVTTALELELGVFPVDKWYRSMEGTSPINYGTTVSHLGARFNAFHAGLEIGHHIINPSVIGRLGAQPAGSNRPAGPNEIKSMEAGIRRGLAEGAIGVGFGINYTPAATPAEIETMFRVAAVMKAPVFVHTRKMGLPPILESIDAAKKTGASLHIVHVGSSGLDELPDALVAIDAARASGLDITTEVYPYTAASTLLESAFFDPGWQENLKISYGDLAWAATGERLTRESFERYRKQGGFVIIYMMKEENVSRAIAHPGVMIASDGVPFINGKGHPRGAGTFARVLGLYSREKKLLPLMEALAKMTSLPAQRLAHIPAMRSKGRLAVGADADIAVFNPATVIDKSTFTEPTNPSAGISHVLVNGTFVVRDSRLVAEARPGRAIRATP